MQLSRFVIIHEGVREDENVLYNVLSDRYVGVNDAVLELVRRLDKGAPPELLVHYFGGEPLTRKDVVLRTAEVLSASMAARGGTFAWEMTTNGVHLDLPFVEAMRPFGEGMVRVTLDGDQETHDQARV